MNKCTIKIDEQNNIIFECLSSGSDFKKCEHCKLLKGRNVCIYLEIDNESLTQDSVIFLCDSKRAQNEALRTAQELIDKEISDREFDFDTTI